MKKIELMVILVLTFLSCKETPTQFSEAALGDQFVNLNGELVTFESILQKHKGKTVLITIWATWCRDCRGELPRVKALQQEKTEIDYVFLSQDRSIENWKSGISQLGIEGDHYFMPLGWESPFTEFIDMDWITRYMVIDPEGNIKLYEAIKANNIYLKESLNN